MSLRQSGAQKVTNFVNAINGLISSHNSSSTAHSTEMAKKVNINQGTTNNGKFLKVSSGNVTCESVTIPSASSSTPSADVSGGAIGSSSNYAKADHQHPLSSAYATSGHNHDGTYLKSYTPPTGSTSQAGIVQLEDSVSSSSTAKAATPNSVKTAYNLANGKVSTNQGTSNSGKFLKVNSSGNVACESVTIPSAYTHPSQSLGTLPSSASLKKIKYDANGHITATADVAASDLPSHTHDQYLTSHQDISNLATKSQVEEVSAKADSKQNELIAGSNITLTATSELPSGYTQLDYIVGNKSQYLDTGWKFTNTYPVKIDCKFMPYEATGVSGYGIPYGLQTTGYTNWIYPFYMGNGFYLHLGGSAGIDSIPIVFNSIYDTSFTINNGTWSRTINGETTTGSYSGSIDTTSNMYLMGGSHGNQPINQMSGRIYSFKITVNNNVVLNYIPARRNSDNAIGMYDTVSSTFKASSGGGSFVGGNAISKTTISTANMDTVQVLVTYTDNTTETLNLFKQVSSS